MDRKRLLGWAGLMLWFLALPARAAIGTFYGSGQIVGLPTGTLQQNPPGFAASAAIGQVSQLALTTATAAITVPSGATAVLLVMPAGNTTAVDLGGGYTSIINSGIHLSGTPYWAFLPLASGATLWASSSAAVTVTATFF